MTAESLFTLILAAPALYLAARWLRAQLAMRRLRNLGQTWTSVQSTWDHLARLPAGAHSPTVRTAFGSLQRSRLMRLRALAPDHERAGIQLRQTSQFLRGQSLPPSSNEPATTKTKLAAVKALRTILNSKPGRAAIDSGLVIRTDAELNQWQARLELDGFTSGAMRDALLGRRREALQGIKQALTCLPKLPVKDAEAWRLKLTAEQQRLRRSASSRAA